MEGFRPPAFYSLPNRPSRRISLQVRLLADDCILYLEINTLDDCQDLQKDMGIFCNWESKRQMKLNIDKCYIMHVTHKRNHLLMTNKMNGRPIEVTASHTYLGIGKNNKLSWAEHISNTVSKANKVLGLLRRNLYSCSSFDNEAAYRSLVRPKLEYCSCILDPYHQEYENKLELVQRRAARFVCIDLRRQSHVSDMLRDLNWKTLEDRRTISRLTQLHKSVHNIVAINIVEQYANHEKEIFQPEKRPQFPFLILLPERIATCTPLSLELWLSGTVYLPLSEKPNLLTLLRPDCAVLSFLLIWPETKLLNHVRWPPHTCSCHRLSRTWRSDCSTRQKQKLKKHAYDALWQLQLIIPRKYLSNKKMNTS